MVNYPNKDYTTTLGVASTHTVGIVDGDDHIHSGIAKVLEQAARGNYVVEYGNLVQAASGGYTQFSFDGTMEYYRDNKLYSATPAAVSLGATSGLSNDRYDMLVIAKGSPDALAIRPGYSGATPRVPDVLTSGDIPVALIHITAGSANDIDTRPLQLYGYTKDENSLSIAYNGGGTTYTETASIIGAGTGTTLQNSVNHLELKSVGDLNLWIDTDNNSTSKFNFYGYNAVIAELNESGDLQIDGDLTVSGGDIINAAATDFNFKSNGNMTFIIDNDNDETSQVFVWKNYTTDIMHLSEGGNLTLDLGDLVVNGNTITFGNGAIIENTSAALLTITEATVTASGHITAGASITSGTNVVATTSVAAGTTVSATTNLSTARTIQLIPHGGNPVLTHGAPSGGAGAGAGTILSGNQVYSLSAIEPTGGATFFALPSAAVAAANGVMLTIKNMSDTVAATVESQSGELIDGGSIALSIIAAPNQITLAPMGSVTLAAFVETYWTIGSFPSWAGHGWMVTGHVA